MRIALIFLFAIVFAFMLFMTIRASLENRVFNVPSNVLADRWFQATLVDAYLGFITFYVWVAYRETTWLGRFVWFLLIMGLGNMAMSAYVLIRLVRLPPGSSVEDALFRSRDGRIRASASAQGNSL